MGSQEDGLDVLLQLCQGIESFLQLFLFDEEIDLKHLQGALIGERREVWLLLSRNQHLLGIF